MNLNCCLAFKALRRILKSCLLELYFLEIVTEIITAVDRKKVLMLFRKKKKSSMFGKIHRSKKMLKNMNVGKFSGTILD